MVEPAVGRDLEAIADLDQLAFGPPARPDALLRAIESGTCWVARDSGHVVGFAVFDRFLHGHGFLRIIAVHPDHRRKGVARDIVSRLEATCPTDRLFTATDKSNAAMQQLCQALGFVRSGEIYELEDGHTELIYLKRLARPH